MAMQECIYKPTARSQFIYFIYKHLHIYTKILPLVIDVANGIKFLLIKNGDAAPFGGDDLFVFEL